MTSVELRRRLDDRAYAEVVALAASAGRGGHAALGEARWLELDEERRAPGSVPGFAALLVPAPGRPGTLSAYGQLRRGPSGWDLEMAVAEVPGAERLRAAVARRALVAVAAGGGGSLQWFVPVAGPSDDDVAASLALRPVRELLQLRRPLPLDGALAARAARVRARPFRPGTDERAWLAVNNAAFAGHPDQGSWDEATVRAHEALDWFDPDGFLVVDGDGDGGDGGGGLAGFCWTKRELATPEVGEIYVLGVAPAYQGTGLGASLLAVGCQHLFSVGARQVTLYVDAGNAPALRLYRSAGFVEDHVDRVYGGHVEATDPLGGARAPDA